MVSRVQSEFCRDAIGLFASRGVEQADTEPLYWRAAQEADFSGDGLLDVGRSATTLAPLGTSLPLASGRNFPKGDLNPKEAGALGLVSNPD